MTTTPPSVRVPPPPPGWKGSRTRRGPKPPQDRATKALVFGAMSMVVNPLLIPSLIGILYGLESLKAGTAERWKAIAGIIGGSVGLALVAVGLGAFALLHAGLEPLAQHQIEDSITRAAAQRGLTLTDVTCGHVSLPTTPGATVDCAATTATESVALTIAFTDDSGAFRIASARQG